MPASPIQPAGYFSHARRDIAPLLPQRFDSVLDVGCGAGATLQWLRQGHSLSRCVGVECSPGPAGLARAHADEVLELDLMHQPTPVQLGRFDLVLCLDVLEHLLDPWGLAARLVQQHLAPDGTLIVSLPNVRHYSVLWPLVFSGRWEYGEAGLLDRTHLRFFTRRSALELMTQPGLADVRYHATGFDGWALKAWLNRLSGGVFAEFVTYQHLLAGRRQA